MKVKLPNYLGSAYSIHKPFFLAISMVLIGTMGSTIMHSYSPISTIGISLGGLLLEVPTLVVGILSPKRYLYLN
jgi:hypothetical protein